MPSQMLALPGIPCLGSLGLLLGHVQAFSLGAFSQGWTLPLLGRKRGQAAVWGRGGQSRDTPVGVSHVWVRPV